MFEAIYNLLAIFFVCKNSGLYWIALDRIGLWSGTTDL